jgi:CRISPR-associated protein Cas2
MALTVLITRDVEDRYRGFLASAMLELAPGVYASPHLSARAREKVWGVLCAWHVSLPRGAITMVHADRQADGGLAVRSLGTPPRRPVRVDGVLLMVAGGNPG